MQTILGVLGVSLIILSLLGVLQNGALLFFGRRYRRAAVREGLDPSLLNATAPYREQQLSTLLLSLGMGAIGVYFLVGDDISFVKMIGAFLTYMGYGAVIQSFRTHHTAAQVSRYSDDSQEPGRAKMHSLIFGLGLLGVGVYLLL